MNIPELYDYLVRARRDLWVTLEDVPDEVLSRPLLGGERFHSIKDLVQRSRIPHSRDVTSPSLRCSDSLPKMYRSRRHQNLQNAVLVFHTANVEDSWIHLTVLGDTPVEDAFPAIRAAGDGPVYAAFPLAELLEYWRAVETSTLAYLATLTDADLEQIVEDAPGEHFRLGGLLWHVLLHEVRHTAQIAALLRTQGIRPPPLDLFFYLPNVYKP